MAKTFPEFASLDCAQIAHEVLQTWEKNNVFEKSVTMREGAPHFTFYEGPPSANGTPGIHHVMARTVKDIFCRFKTLQGFQVKRKGGWDTHGLPVELQVEKMLGITKEDIGKKISIADYNRHCKETVMKYKHEWDTLTKQMGYWVDLEHPYITYESNYIESIWWILQQFYKKGWLYKGYTIQPYSPSDGTGLSSHELNQPGCYRNVKDTSIVAQFAVTKNNASQFLFDKSSSPVYLLAWTTTPWTLPSNTSLVVNERIAYVQVKTFNPYTSQPISVVLAKELVKNFFTPNDATFDSYKAGDKKIPFEVVQEFSGKQLVGIRYEQLMPYVQPLYDADKAFVVVHGDFVTTDDGTGIVHSSPTFGADDFASAKKNGIPPLTVRDENGNEVPTVDRQGKFVNAIGEKLQEGIKKFNIKTHRPLRADEFYVKNYLKEDEAAPDYKSTDVIISIILKEENKAFKVEKYEHSYPHSWRTDMPVLYYPLDAWFIKTTALREQLVSANKTINWKPESTGTGRFGNWLENVVDWNLSRSRFWGTPLPIWRTKDGKEELCIGSLAELKTEIEKAKKNGHLPNNFVFNETDLHRPYVDDVVLSSPSGKPMFREPDLIDVWFDSGAMPYAQWHYPFENKAIFDKAYPADFIAEGVDQTRGWFFTLHAIAVMLNASNDEIQKQNQKNKSEGVAFRNVVSNGLVLDKDGNKMSKRKGNVVDPFVALSKHGADVVRWYMMENAPPWDNIKYNEETVEETKRRFFGTLFNTYSFFALYANIDGYSTDVAPIPFSEKPYMDQWIISRLQTVMSDVVNAYSDYDPTTAARLIQEFTQDHLSNWYVRLNRKRFWQPALRGSLSADKISAYHTLHECLSTLAQLMSPIAPFFGEWLYKNVNRTAESVHYTRLADADNTRRNATAEEAMENAQRICSLVHSIRKEHKIKVRIPLQKILIPSLTDETKKQIQQTDDIIKSEVNVKEILFIEDTAHFVTKKIKPNFSKVGKKLGAQLKDFSKALEQLSQEQIGVLEKTGTITAGAFTVAVDDVLIQTEDVAGWAVATDGKITVALDIQLTESLQQEGLARELVNRIQNARKDKKFDVLDKIRVEIKKSPLLEKVLQQHQAYVQNETQAISCTWMTTEKASEEMEWENEKIIFSVEKV